MKVSWQSWLKLGAFAAAGVGSALLVTNTLAVPVRGHTTSYVAQFSSVEGLNVGNPVTMNGIRIGRVDAIAFADNGQGTSRADVTIEVTSRNTLSSEVSAAVRYGDMLGARYIALADPGAAIMEVSTDEPPTRLAAGGVIPLGHTSPAVDLTALLNGFKPLFDALTPEQVNQLTRGLVETFTGQAQSVTALLVQIASLTNSMTTSQQAFTTVVNNVSALLSSTHARQPQLEQMLGGLRRLTDSVTGPDAQLELLIDQGNAVLATLAATVDASGTAYGDTIGNLKSMLAAWEGSTPEFTALVEKLPQFADAVNRTSSYGGFMSLYLCNFTLKIGKHEANIFGRRHSEVCL